MKLGKTSQWLCIDKTAKISWRCWSSPGLLQHCQEILREGTTKIRALKKFLGNAGVVPSLNNGTIPKHEVFKQFLRCCNMKSCNHFNFWPFICRVRSGINIIHLFNLHILAKSEKCLLSANTSWHMHMANILLMGFERGDTLAKHTCTNMQVHYEIKTHKGRKWNININGPIAMMMMKFHIVRVYCNPFTASFLHYNA